MAKQILLYLSVLLMSSLTGCSTESGLAATELSEYDALMSNDTLIKVNSRNYTRSRIAYHYLSIATAVNSALHEPQGKIITSSAHLFFRKDNYLELRLLDTSISNHSFIMKYEKETILSDGGAGLKESEMNLVVQKLRRALYEIEGNDFMIHAY